MKFQKRKGFTLVEFMVVIAVIGVLAAMTSLKAVEFVATAKARVIVSNLNAFKKAVNYWYTKHKDLVMTNNTKTEYGICANYQTYTENGVTYAYLTPTTYRDGDANGGWKPIQEWWENRTGASRANRELFKASILSIIEGKDGSIKVSGSGWAAKVAPMVYDGYLLNDNDKQSGSKQGRTAWFVGYVIPQGLIGDMVKEKLAAMAKSQNLISDKAKGCALYNGGEKVWMMMVDFAPGS